MDNKKKQKATSSSSSSITSQLFGPPELDVLASIFPPSKGMARNSTSGSKSHTLSTKQGSGGANKDRSSMYQQEGVEPSYLSSSLYYGGQETYSRSPTTHHHHHPSSYPFPKFKKDDGEDDPSDAARGNWWQGSLYY